MEGFLCYRFGGVIFGGAYFWNPMVLGSPWTLLLWGSHYTFTIIKQVWKRSGK